MVEPLGDYWFAISTLGGAFRLEDGHYVMQDWDQKQECLKIGDAPKQHPTADVEGRAPL
ncbi:hypothetical protein BD413DRAFT_614328 [Trametes elegans]|nr:hypothetical protein BD413DRAFT_614328 [Trametes elegans]